MQRHDARPQRNRQRGHPERASPVRLAGAPTGTVDGQQGCQRQHGGAGAAAAQASAGVQQGSRSATATYAAGAVDAKSVTTSAATRAASRQTCGRCRAAAGATSNRAQTTSVSHGADNGRAPASRWLPGLRPFLSSCARLCSCAPEFLSADHRATACAAASGRRGRWQRPARAPARTPRRCGRRAAGGAATPHRRARPGAGAQPLEQRRAHGATCPSRCAS